MIAYKEEEMNRRECRDAVFLQVEIFRGIASYSRLGEPEHTGSYMPALLDAIVDTSENIRVEARNILKLAKLPDQKLVNKCVDGVLKSLEMYPQDEPDTLSALFHFGQGSAFSSYITRDNNKQLWGTNSHASCRE